MTNRKKKSYFQMFEKLERQKMQRMKGKSFLIKYTYSSL